MGPAQTLVLAGAQSTQLLVEPPWRPAVVWDRVTLTCQGSGSAFATTWYKDGQRWGQIRHDHRFTVTESGTYKCERPRSGFSHPVTVLNDQLVLQVPARTLLEGDTVTLRCRAMQHMSVSRVRFYKDGKDLGESPKGTELSLSPLQLNHSGCYHCQGSVRFQRSSSSPVTVTVHVAAGVSGSLLFLVLLVAVIVARHRWHHLAIRKCQKRVPSEPPAPPEEGEVLYTHVVITKQTQRPAHVTIPQEPQVTYAELPGPHGRPQERSDICDIVP
ncbi:low affinity immunoglobulin gamma Fc region receptor III-like [Sylvia borin]